MDKSTRYLKDIMEWEGKKITYPAKEVPVYNMQTGDFHKIKDLSVKEKKNGIFIKARKSAVKEYDWQPVENFVVPPITSTDNIIYRSRHTPKNEKLYPISITSLKIDKYTHPYNMWVIRYLLEAYGTHLFSSNAENTYKGVKHLRKTPEIPVSHKNMNKMLLSIGSSYELFMNWITEYKTRNLRKVKKK